ncbi:CD209 antigen-like protein C [Channa argus]|uniref:CD209 antigen-like protein C n=1 Tax=Channa argus TaxID=215402 RepID=UPI003521ED1A
MEEIYMNVEPEKHLELRTSTDETGSRCSEKKFHGAVLFSGLLSVCLLAVLIGLIVHYRDSSHRLAAELSAVKANLTERFQASDGQLSLLTAERDQLNASLIAMTGERNRLQSLSKQKKTCPTGWRKFSCSCYLLSSLSGSWERGRADCRAKGADLVVIESDEVQTFVSGLTQQPAWIGLNDKEVEGTWKWIDGTPLIKTYWVKGQPDNGGGSSRWGDEDCAHIRNEENTRWNDLSCTASLRWICEKLL